MKKTAFSIIFGLVLSLTAGSALAITLSFAPVNQAVNLGDPVSVSLTISGLTDFAAPSLSIFDLNVTFNSSILAFSSATYGDPILGDQLDLFGFGSITATMPGAGLVNLFELSFDLPNDLNTLQAGAFTLATLTFNTLALGISPLNLTVNALGDALGDPLVATVQSGSVSVVPEPSTLLLVGSGLIGLAAWRKRKLAKTK